MAIAADPFAPPRAIGQGLTGIVQQNYPMMDSGGESVAGGQQAAAGPFAPVTGALGENADRAREGLAALFQGTPGGGGGGLDAASSALPINTLGLPALGGSPVSTGGAAAGAARTANSASASGLSRLASIFGPSFGGGETGSGGGLSLTGETAAGGGRAPNLGMLGTVAGLMGMLGGVPGLGLPFGLANLGNRLADLRDQLAISNPGVFGSPFGSFALSPQTALQFGLQRSGERTGQTGEPDVSPPGPPADTSPNAGVAPDTGQSSSSGGASAGDSSAGDAGSGAGPGPGGAWKKGGTVPNVSRAPGGAEPITAHQGEEIINPSAAALFRPLLKQINAAVPPNGLRRLL